jgi:hypothetical protein
MPASYSQPPLAPERTTNGSHTCASPLPFAMIKIARSDSAASEGKTEDEGSPFLEPSSGMCCSVHNKHAQEHIDDLDVHMLRWPKSQPGCRATGGQAAQPDELENCFGTSTCARPNDENESQARLQARARWRSTGMPSSAFTRKLKPRSAFFADYTQGTNKAVEYDEFVVLTEPTQNVRRSYRAPQSCNHTKTNAK